MRSVTQPLPPTSSGTSRLSEVARHLVVPAGVVSTGWPAVRDTCARLDVRFDRWQDGAGRLILGKRADGLYAADTVVLSIPRQVGKTFLVGWIVFALCLIFPGLTVMWTAHRYKTASETFKSMKAMAGRRKLAAHVGKVVLGAGDQAILFTNGSRVLFGARERGFGRGFAHVDVEIFDEAQILTQNAIDDMIPATNAAPNPLLIYTGTPPKPADPGEVFTEFRELALSGESADVLYVEISADRDAHVLDKTQWVKANPSYPHRTPERSILRMIKNLTRESFLREGFGIWDETAHKPVLARSAWDALQAKGELPDVPANALGIDTSPGGEFFAAGCWLDADAAHVELLPLPGDLVAMADLIAARAGRRIPVLMHTTSPAKELMGLLVARRCKVRVTAGPDMATASGALVTDMDQNRLTHAGQAALTAALMAARKKPYGKAGAWVWDFTTDGVAPLVAVTLARLGASKKARHKTGQATFA